MWNDHTYLLQTLCKASQHDYICVFSSNEYSRFKAKEPHMKKQILKQQQQMRQQGCQAGFQKSGTLM